MVLLEPCQDTAQGYIGLKYFDHCLRRWNYTEPTYEYVWFGTISDEAVTHTETYECYDSGDMFTESITAPIFTSHCELSKHIKTGMWCICHLSVHSAYQKQGLSKLLIKDIVEFCKQNDIKHIQRTKPSKEGKDYLYQNMSNALTAAGITFSAYS